MRLRTKKVTATMTAMFLISLSYIVTSAGTWSTSYDSPESRIYSLAAYNNKLYAGSTSNGIIYVYDGTTWATSYDSPASSIYSLAAYNNKLYAGSCCNGIIYVYDGASWATSYSIPESRIYSLAVYNNKLYAGCDGGIIYEYDGTSWATSYDNPESSIYSLAVYNNKLYAGSGDNGIVFVYEEDTMGPITSNLSATPNPTNCATDVALSATVDDSTTGNSNIQAAEYFIDTVGAYGTGTAMTASDGLFDEVAEDVAATVPVGALSTGPHTLYVYGQDVQGKLGAYQNVTLTVSCQKTQIRPQPPDLTPTAQNHISQGKDLLTQANDLLTQAKSKGLDTTQCEKLISEATELLDKAKTVSTNPVYANNLALQAIAKLKDAIDCLKALLG